MKPNKGLKTPNTTVQRANSQPGTTRLAPPVYRPQPVPKVLQRKVATVNRPQTGSANALVPNSAPKAPPAYKPQPVPKVLQRKTVAGHPPAGAPARPPATPPRPPAAMRPPVVSVKYPAQTLQAKSAAGKPFGPARLMASSQNVVQLVMAYRVERESKKGGGYRLEVDDKSRSIKSLGVEPNISISFGTEAHSEHFLAEHEGENPRLVTWEMDDAFWNMIKYKKGFGKQADKDAGHEELKKKSAPKSTPSGSDGANLDSLTKKTALTFGSDWYKSILKHQVKGTTSVTIFEKEDQEYELVDPTDDQRIDIGTKEAMTQLKADFGAAGTGYVIRRA